MRRSQLPLSTIYALVQAYLKDPPPARPRPRGRPLTYPEDPVADLLPGN